MNSARIGKKKLRMNLPNQTELRRIARMLDANFLVSENNLLNTVMEEEEKRNKEATRIYPDSMGVRSIAVQPLEELEARERVANMYGAICNVLRL